ncbi:MAG: Hsp20/alpha crystallin family protein [Phycisphaerae bacterium]|jgi:HSP20 family protein|nr:Hsp20/alpha crystallin family protein [Phycisphaerae bacterium]MDP7286853.1 Hsp20/alpha crystallin family protein [Phycisphaerae bacterium]
MMTPITVQATHDKSGRAFKPPHGISQWGDNVLGGGGYQQYCSEQTWSPDMNVYESPQQYTLVVDLAGLRGEDIELESDDGVLRLSGQRDMPDPHEPADDVKIRLMEIDHGWFCRAIEIPDDADESRINATCRSGFLRIVLPKKK